jgi:hypothetical protein
MEPVPNCRVGPIRPLKTNQPMNRGGNQLSKRSPNGRCSEEDLIVRTRQLAGLIGLADTGNVGKDPFLNSDLHKGSENCCNHLDFIG